MKIASIDPGKAGYSVAVDSETGHTYLYPLSFSKDNLLDSSMLDLWLQQVQPDLLLLEKVSGRKGWGATQNFNFGSIWGQVRGVVSTYPHRLVTPAQWQKVVHEGVDTKLEPKARSLIAYKQLAPNLPLPTNSKGKLDDNIMDAFLISIYGLIKFAKIKTLKWEVISDE